MKEFYQMTSQETKIAINGSEAPLTEEQVAANRERYGPNALAEGKKKSVAQIFLEQFKDFLVVILIIAAIVSGVLGDFESAAVILIVIHTQCCFRNGADGQGGTVSGQPEENVGSGS